ncbi:MAG: septum formation protein Maf [Clostridia bacterium]|nr:septum formation protein Maf [Clostridia bacterium]
MKVILASASPRRRELLLGIIPDFEVTACEVDETLPAGTPINEGVRLLAVRKGEAALRLRGEEYMIISSDTLVELDGVPLGKPRSEEEAKEMLSRLSGRGHNVHTGVAVHFGGRVLSGTATSTVYFRRLTAAEIEAYVATGEPMDKAGAYGIQGEGGKLVERYDGDFDTIMGLSLALTSELIKQMKELTNDEG